jgi:hypothetical protein
VKFSAFERSARRAFEEIPPEYLEGIDGLMVSREAPAHPTLPEVFTLGQCLTEEHVSEYGGPDTTRSVIALYWGSFRELSTRDPDFDWEGEIWETLTHELRHHLESLAGDDALEDVDYAADETFKRMEGLDFDPWYYQRGEPLEGGVFKVEGDYYVEQLWTEADFLAAPHLEVGWKGTRYRLRRPESLGDVHFVWSEAIDDAVELVLVRRRSWWEDVRRMFGTSRPVVIESVVDGEPLGGTG